MLLDAIFLFLGLALLLFGGDWLVRGASRLAQRLGVAPLVIGLTIVAFGTSAPELLVNLIAASTGKSDIGFGNVVGSNIANIGLLLGITALVRPLKVSSTVVWREIPMMLLVSVATLVFAADRWLSPADPDQPDVIARGEGIALLLLFTVFFYYLVRDALAPANAIPPALNTQPDLISQPQPAPAGTHSIGRSVLLILVGLGALILGGRSTVVGAVGLSEAMGLPTVFVSLTIVAVGTSLPELATSVAAVRRGEDDLAVGNIVGSNIFNLSFILGLTAAWVPMPIPDDGLIDLLVMTGFALLLMPLARTGKSLNRYEAGALLIGYVGYIALLTQRSL